MSTLTLPTTARRHVIDASPLCAAGEEQGLPRIDVIVAFRNEAGLIGPKVGNLRALDYPPELLRFILVDGGSEDGSVAEVRDAVKCDSRFRVVRGPRNGKTSQLNRALRWSNAPWALLTDADALLPGDSLRRLAEKAMAREDVGLVGAICRPLRPIAVDREHWALWNLVRRMESVLGCATALGPCYMVRRSALSGWPDDVVADDVYASLEVHRAGLRAVLAEVIVEERRAPGGIRSFLWHKVRKARAVVREFARFLPRAAQFPRGARAVHVVRTGLFLVGPFLALALVGVAAFRNPIPAAVVGALMACSFASTADRFRVVRPVAQITRTAAMFTVLSIVLAFAIITYPFVRQNAIYSRWRQEAA